MLHVASLLPLSKCSGFLTLVEIWANSPTKRKVNRWVIIWQNVWARSPTCLTKVHVSRPPKKEPVGCFHKARTASHSLRSIRKYVWPALYGSLAWGQQWLSEILWDGDHDLYKLLHPESGLAHKQPFSVVALSKASHKPSKLGTTAWTSKQH